MQPTFRTPLTPGGNIARRPPARPHRGLVMGGQVEDPVGAHRTGFYVCTFVEQSLSLLVDTEVMGWTGGVRWGGCAWSSCRPTLPNSNPWSG
jgi:hypothetical protein